MSTERNKLIVRRLIEEVFGGGNLALADELVADDCVAYDVATPIPARGPAGIREVADRYRRAFPDLRLTVERQIAEGDMVATCWRSSSSNAGKLVGVSPGDAQIASSGVRLSRIADGKIVEDRMIWDAREVLQSFGMIRTGEPAAWERTQPSGAPIRVEEARLPEVGGVLGRAFLDDPMYVYVLPDATHRARVLPAYCAAAAGYGHRFGEVYTTAGPVMGAAIWLPPGRGELTPERLAAAGFPAATGQFGAEARGRLVELIDYLTQVRRRVVPGPHWYLMMIGVDPAWQGRGIGGRLLEPVLTRAAAAGLACYLETTQPRNLEFYRRHGFEVVIDADLPGGGPHYWAMWRPPRP